MDNPKNIALALKRIKVTTRQREADIIQSKEIKRADRELLIRTHWLQEIMKRNISPMWMRFMKMTPTTPYQLRDIK